MGVIVGHILLISAQVNTRRGVPMLEEVTFGTFAEVQRGATSAIATIRDNWVNYVALQDVRAENARLKQELASLQMGLQQERALAQQSRSLQGLLELKSSVQLKTTAAAVIAGGASPTSARCRSTREPGMDWPPIWPCIAPAGVVGRDRHAGPAGSQSSVADRSRCGGRGDCRAHARAGRCRWHRHRPFPSGPRAWCRRHSGRRSRS